MGTTYRAHIFKQAQVGMREEVKIKIFGPDGELLDLGGGGEGNGSSGPSLPPGGTTGQMLAKTSNADGAAAWVNAPSTAGAMSFKGVWRPIDNYKTNDVVNFNDGSGMKTYIFTQDHNAGLPEFADVNGKPVSKFWDPLTGYMDLVLGPNSLVGGGGMAQGIYDMFLIRVNTMGLLSLKAADVNNQAQDLGAVLWHQKPDSTWESVSTDDDNSGFGKPWIRYAIPNTHVLPGLYAYYLSKYSSGQADAIAYGTSRVTVGPDNTAVIGSFADFPAGKTVPLGAVPEPQAV